MNCWVKSDNGVWHHGDELAQNGDTCIVTFLCMDRTREVSASDVWDYRARPQPACRRWTCSQEAAE